MIHAIADDKPRAGCFRAMQQSRQILWRVLSVAVERHGPIETKFERVRQAGFQRRAFAEIAPVPQDSRAGIFRQKRGLIRRTVIHDQHRGELPAQRAHQRRDAGAFVETRNHRGAADVGIGHGDSVRIFAGEIEKIWRGGKRQTVTGAPGVG